ncbi:hypothetical protein [Thermococcus kodakarensis]|uniref:hypothetical protein n=1 Tax=Thermococcus kodakarensis TaxID=311400 RepID=UPI00117FF238|nr:hypothetical protein [Thermococcus kodakarensis]WCN28593.1 hypothetical protein POG15_02775 [Thermococcus kodakarensis]WCN30891.1 hypothetical protein POG21_02775 [Thermococcus kodakarensis]
MNPEKKSKEIVLTEVPWLAEDYQSYLRRILEEKERERKEVIRCLKELTASARKILPKELVDIIPFSSECINE